MQEEVPIHPWLQYLPGPWCPQRGRGPSTFPMATLLRAGRRVTGKRHGWAVLFRVGRAEVVSGTAGQDLLASPFPRPNVAVLLGAHGLREEPEFVTARAGESVVLRCDVVHPVTGQPPPYVVEWFKFGVPIPIFIKFGYYPPHVDPEYAGKGYPIALASCLALGGAPALSPLRVSCNLLSFPMGLLSLFSSRCLCPPILCTLVGFN